MIQKTDVVIIGAGPVGLFGIFECGMLSLKCHVIDALEAIGGQCVALYPEKPIYDIPGYPEVKAGDLITYLKKQAEPFQPTFHLKQQVTKIAPLSDGGDLWQIETSTGVEIQTQCILIAAGVGAFGPHRPPIEGVEDFEGSSIHYAVSSIEAYRGKKVVIAGGGDSAVDWALALSKVADQLFVVHRRDKFRAAPDSVKKLHALDAAGKLKLVIPYQLSGLKGTGGALEAVIVKTLDGDQKQLPADFLLPFFGLSMDLGPITEWELGLKSKHIIIDPTTAATNRPGIYAVGDVATYSNKLKLILTGFAEAAQAAHSMRHFLYPDEQIHFEYSTTKGLPGQ